MSDDVSEQWKKKYFSSLQRLEQQERYLAEVEEVMRSGIARLCVVAESVEPRLDRELEKLRRAARHSATPAEIRTQIDSVSESLKRFDVRRETGEAVAPAAKQLMQDLLGRVELPSVDREAVSALSHAVSSVEVGHELGALALDFSALLNRALRRPAPLPESAPDAIPPGIEEVLIQLLNCMPAPFEMVPRLELVKDRLSRGVSAHDWIEVLRAIVEIISEMRRRLDAEKSELENFLLQLQDRLKDLDQHLEVAETARRASYDSGRQLDRTVSDEVSSIETSIHQAASLDQIKTTITQRMDIIRSHMTEYRRAEEQRHAALEEKLKHATSRLQAVERETLHLRGHLRKRKVQAMSDPLTGISNRMAFEERLAREFGRWKRYGTSLTLMILDVDHFKRINDTYGHRAGDKALKLIAIVLRRNIRETDMLARYGGEEFAIVAPQTPTEGILVLAEKLRVAVERAEFHYHGMSVPITISSGFASFRSGDTPDDVFQRADKALYRAKAEGRNRCCSGDA
jgi:diguanylate cyclase